MSSALIQIDVPVFGTVKLVTALFFDLGVYLIVVGLVLDVLRSLGAEGRATMLEMPQFGVSSSAVRERAAAGRPLRCLVPEPVARFIEEKGIYG